MGYAKESELIERMDRAGLDAVILTSPAGVFHASGAWINSQRLIPDRIAAVIWPRAGSPVLLIDALEEGSTRPQTWIGDLRTYRQLSEGPIPAIRRALDEMGHAAARIGLEVRFVSKQFADLLAASLPGAALLPFDDDVNGLLAIKQPWEIERLTANAMILDTAIAESAAAARPGMTERAIGMALLARLVAAGEGNYSQFGAVVASGPNARVTHYGMGDRQIAPGDLIRLGCRGVYKGYHAILARTGVVGAPSARRAAIFADLAALHAAHITNMRPGAIGSDLYDACMRRFAERGYRLPLPHTGHAVGLALQERPQFHPGSTDALAANMMCIAITVIDDDQDGKYYLEDVVRVTTAGGVSVSDGSGAATRLIEIG